MDYMSGVNATLAEAAAQLAGVPLSQIIKIRPTDDGLVVIIATGQKYSYTDAQLSTAIEGVLIVRAQLEEQDKEKPKAKAKSKK